MPRKGPFELHVDDIEYYLNSIRSTFMDGSSLVDMANRSVFRMSAICSLEGFVASGTS